MEQAEKQGGEVARVQVVERLAVHLEVVGRCPGRPRSDTSEQTSQCLVTDREHWRSVEGRRVIQQEVPPGSLGELGLASEEVLASEQESASTVVIAQALRRPKILEELALNQLC